MLRRIAGLIEKHAEHLARIEVCDNGKLISEMLAQTKYLPEWFYYYGGLADKIQGAVVPSDRADHFTYILREPVDVCAFITPWNLPLMLTGWKLAPAAPPAYPSPRLRALARLRRRQVHAALSTMPASEKAAQMLTYG